MGCKPSVDATDKMENISSVTTSDYLTKVKAVILIQNLFRRYKARCLARRQMAWRIHQLIEYSHEESELALRKMFSIMFLNLGRVAINKNHLDKSECPLVKPIVDQSVDWGNADIQDLDFKGVRITYPITQECVKRVMDYLQHGNKISHRDLLELICRTQIVLRTKPNINEISFKSVTVCGDIHGSLDDLITIFKKNCLPSASNPYVFNGDFVDRGPKSLEVLIVLFASFLCNPESVFMNRGNHEDHIMNLKYGFFKEISVKYKAIAPDVIKLLTSTFPLLPLATVINHNVLVVHGGISNETDLAVIKNLEREKFTSVLNFDCDDMSRDTLAEWKQILNLLWSDPKPCNGVKPNVYRGAGCYFGPDVTSSFLLKNDLKLLVRSHECMMEGWDWCHNGQVLSIFSASNYYELGSNFGAFVIIDEAARTEIVQFKSDDNTKRSKCEEEALHCLKVEMCRNKQNLMRNFMNIDGNHSGVVSANDWVATMSTVMNMDLPWRQLRPYFGICDLSGDNVHYRNILEEIDLEINGQIKDLSNNVSESGDDVSIEMMFQVFDERNQGKFKYEDFKNGFLKNAFIDAFKDDREVKRLWKSLDLNEDGFVDKYEFFTVIRKLI